MWISPKVKIKNDHDASRVSSYIQNGKVLSPYPSTNSEASRDNLYKIRAVDIRIAFISEKPFFRFESRTGNERQLSGFSRAIRSFSDRNLRDNVVVTVYTRNIVGQDIF